MEGMGTVPTEEQSSGEVRVLLVDDDPGFADVASRLLERRSAGMSVDTVSSACAALDRLAEADLDAVVSDYAMPGMDGLELLDAIRAARPDLPFVLLTGKGSEDVASEAIARGADDYLQKGIGTDMGEVLANRIANAVERTRSQAALQQREARFRTLIEHSPATISVLAPDGTYTYVSPSVRDLFGYDPAELVGTDAFARVHPEDREAVWEAFSAVVQQPDEMRTVECRYKAAGGEWHWIQARGKNRLDDPAVEGIVVNTQDVSEQKERERRLQRQNERLDEFASVVSHDLRNPLNAAMGHVDLARTECDSDHLDAAARALGRMDALVADVLTLARQGGLVEQPDAVDLAAVVDEAWATVAPDGDLRVELDDATVLADPSRLQRVFENLFRNAAEHAGPGATVRVGLLADRRGFYVADDGPGIPETDRERVFDHGYSTSDEGTGFGLSIVQNIVEAHGWTIAVTEGRDGGARFEITGVDPG